MAALIKAAVLVQQDTRFLLVQEAGPPMDGFWNWPQGRVEEGEAIEEAAAREAREETGFEVKIGRKVAVLTRTFPDIKELHVYLATIAGGELDLPSSEIRDARFFLSAEVAEMRGQLVGPWILDTINQVTGTGQ